MKEQRTDYMAQAIALARRALGRTRPNPAVGAVIVDKGGAVVGEGWTQPAGSDHAEIVALKQAGERARGATLYVSLEPCCHFGRTPPCSKALIAAGVAEVHIATLDPNPPVDGKGKAELEAAGIAVHLGAHEAEAQELNEAYFYFIQSGRPFVIAKYAISLDGKLATQSGDARWISGEASRALVHRLRDTSDAIMVGVNTVLADDPELTARPGGVPAADRQPVRIVVDSRGRLPERARLFDQPGQTIVATTEASQAQQRSAFERHGAQVLVLPARQGRVDLRALLEKLGGAEITSLLVEGGGELLGALFDLRLVNKVYAFVGPVILGGSGTQIVGQGVESVAEAIRLSRVRVEQMGEDTLICGYLEER